MIPTAVLDHTALTALYRADSFFTGLYIEASRGTGRVIVPSLSVLAAERLMTGAGRHAAALRFAQSVPFSAAHRTCPPLMQAFLRLPSGFSMPISRPVAEWMNRQPPREGWSAKCGRDWKARNPRPS